MTKEEAIEVVKEAMPTLWKETKEAIQTLIPELAESEDERIRKELLSFIESVQHSYLCATDKRKKWIAYLEKQKEQKPFGHNNDATINTELNAYVCKQYQALQEENGGVLSFARYQNLAMDIWKWCKEQKPVEWSEEDCAKIGTLSSIIFDYAFHKDALDENNDLTGEYAELEDWLESLPERFNLQPKVEWSEEDNRILYNVISYIGFAAGQRGVKNDLFKEANNWLKFLPERFELQSKQEWSEDDEIIRDSIIEYINSGNIYATSKVNMITWLKSLRQQPHWKPSEEQMNELRASYAYWQGITNETPNSKILESLYNDLKKL